jgi:hypothetical protein
LFQLDSSSSTEQTPLLPTPGPCAAAFAAFLHELGCVCPSLLLVFKFLLVSNTYLAFNTNPFVFFVFFLEEKAFVLRKKEENGIYFLNLCVGVGSSPEN